MAASATKDVSKAGKTGVLGFCYGGLVTWLAAIYGISRSEALAIASTCVDLRVTQVVNMTWGVHAVLPAGLLR